MATQDEGFQEALRRIRIEEERPTWNRSIDLHRLGLDSVPEYLSHLPELRELDLSYNNFTTIPELICRLDRLEGLYISNNEITTIPESISRLVKLKSLYLSSNRITTVSNSLSRSELVNLDLSFNQIKAIPESLLQLKNLESLNLSHNQISEIPRWFSQLDSLRELDLSGNPLPDELMAAAQRGGGAFFRYLESVEALAAHPRTVKLVLLGEPAAGKTTLLEALKGNLRPCDRDGKETLGINVAMVDKKNPEDGRLLHLSVWDFAGQHMEHATHQPFLTENAVFLILWNARMGTGAGKRDLWYWLELLKMRVSEPKFLLVATHTELTPPDLNLTEIQRAYGGF